MKIERMSRILPFRCEQVFDLAADIERYPDFLSGWISARILKREATVLHVEQVLGIGPLRIQFGSEAVLHRPERIDVTSSEPPFRHYHLRLLVTPYSAASCNLSATADLELGSRLMQHIADQILPASIDQAIAAFETRAHSLYAPQKPPIDGGGGLNSP